jgi:DNA-binding response OmpR family regulator
MNDMNDMIDILLIEDSPSQATQLRLVLERAGYRVAHRADGVAGWQYAWSNQPRLVLLDIDLPAMNGFQVLGRLKRSYATAGIPVIMLTDQVHISNVEYALGLGASDYVAKEDAVQQLCAVVEGVLVSEAVYAA